jgi:cytidylate kinase
VDENTLATLTGSATDIDGSIAAYSWTQLSGPVVTLSGANSSDASFTAPEVTADTVLSFQLTVTDNEGGQVTDTVDVTVHNVNKLPSANAGTDQTVDENTLATLTGSGTDIDGSIAAYSWTQLLGPVVTLSGANSSNATFTAPEVTADTVLSFQLTVTDNEGGQATDAVDVTVHNVNKLPSTNAGTDQTVDENTLATLNGSATDIDGSIVAYSWTQLSGPVVTLSGANSSDATFTAPEVTADTVLSFQLTVTDNEGGQATDTVDVTVHNVNKLPSANAGTDQTVDENALATLNGSATDIDGSIVAYSWTQLSGPVVTLSGANSSDATFTAPEVTADTVLSFQLTVTDNEGGQATDTVDIIVHHVNKLPAADAGTDQTVLKRSLVTLDGTASSDIDGNIVSYQWQQIQGPSMNLDNPNSSTPSFTAPNVANSPIVLIFQLTVTDNEGGIAIDQVTITVVKK